MGLTVNSLESYARRAARCWACAAVFAVLGGCRTYDQKMRDVQRDYRAGNYVQAADQVAKLSEANRGSRDELIWTLEEAALMRNAGRLDESARAFDRADQLFEKYQQEAKLKLGREGLSLLTNPTELPYTGRAYDGIMISVYQTLGALQKGDREAARVYINRAYERQQDAVAAHAAKIEKESEQIAKNADVSRTMNSPGFASAVSNLESSVSGLAAYADYVNPFAVYLDGLYHLNAGVDASDYQRAAKCFERVQAFAPNNGYVQEDCARAAQAASAKPEESACYVLFETGTASSREAVRIDIPILIARVSYVGVSFPKLKVHDAPVRSLDVEADGKRWQSQRVADMDAVIATDFKNELPSIIAHATASAVAKAAAAYAINTAAKEAGSGAQLAAQLLTAGYQLVMNVADTRTWSTLPKEFQVCRIPMPADRKIALSAAGGGGRRELTLNEGRTVVVWVKAVDRPDQMTVTQFTLR